MNPVRLTALAGVLALALPGVCFAVEPDGVTKPATTTEAGGPAVGYQPLTESSSLAEVPDAPGRVTERPAGTGAYAYAADVKTTATRPFSAFAIAVKVGFEGFGFDVATPLARKLNLRAGASFFSFSPQINSDGINVDGTITFRKVAASLDYFPFGGSFRVSPGVVMYNGNHLTANAVVPGGQTFSLGDGEYTSSTTDPVHGTFDLAFGSKAAPSLTAGFGNILPRKSGKHFSVPFEFGFEYIGSPTVTLTLAGTACQQGQPAVTGCQPIASDTTTQANIRQEQTDINSDLSPLKFYPIVSIGLGYKF